MTTTAPTTRRGGARPRAGAPKGNLNALTTGARSRRLAPVYRAVGPEGARIVIRAITQATDDALTTCPQDDTPRAARLRSRARAYAMKRVLTCAAAITTDLIHTHGLHPALVHAFAPIWRGTDAVPPWLPDAAITSDQHTIKRAPTQPELTPHTP